MALLRLVLAMLSRLIVAVVAVIGLLRKCLLWSLIIHLPVLLHIFYSIGVDVGHVSITAVCVRHPATSKIVTHFDEVSNLVVVKDSASR